MKVFVEAIKFNHDPLAATVDAINIRKNQAESIPIPEWQRGEADAPAAYAISETLGNKLTIQAKFRCAPRLKTLEIRAIDPNCDFIPSDVRDLVDEVLFWFGPASPKRVRNSLGAVKKRQVVFREDGQSQFVTFELENTSLATSGVRVSTVTWQWQYRVRSGDAWINFDTTKHRVYSILKLPKCPWSLEPLRQSNIQLPWSEVLDFACSWAAGAQTLDEAALRITREVRRLETKLKIVYDRGGPYYSLPNFDCHRFLDLIRGGPGAGEKMNCTDFATVVSSFANSLGCDLWQSGMSGGGSFFTNPVRVFGRTAFLPNEFSIHDVAWKNGCTESEEVFDASLLVDGDTDPTSAPHTPKLPANLRFGTVEERGYLFRVAAPLGSHPGSELPHPVPHRRLRRSIRPSSRGGERSIDTDVLCFLKTRYEYSEWRRRAAVSTGLFFAGSPLTKNVLRHWTFIYRPELVLTARWPPTVNVLAKTDLNYKTHLIRFDLDICFSTVSALYFLLRRVASFQSPTLELRKDLPIGDVVLVDTESGAILFSRANLVVLIRNASNGITDLINLAKMFDDDITRHPAQGGKTIGVLDRFYLRNSTINIDEREPLRVHAVMENDTHQFYKFFASSGCIRRQRNALVYCPGSSGLQQLSVFDYQSDGTILGQQINIDVTKQSGIE